jgi:hypothetical protein
MVAEARILGVFQGEIVAEPYKVGKGKWLALQSRNGFVRKVEITEASVTYDEDYPEKERQQDPARGLVPYTLIRVTAEQAKSEKGDGDWKATEILILPTQGGTKRTAQGTVSAAD